MSTVSYPRETIEHLAVPVTVDGVAVTTGVTFAVVAYGTRPTAFVAPTTLGGKIGVMITGLTPGMWEVYAKVASTPETPVINCGSFSVS